MSITIRGGWHQVVTAFPRAETTVAFRYESGEWWIPDQRYNEASLVGARIMPLYLESEVDEMITRIRISEEGK